MSKPLGEEELQPLPEELDRALRGYQALLEPTPHQLETSYRLVKQALSGLPPVASAPGAGSSTSAAGGEGARQERSAGSWSAVIRGAKQRRWAPWGGAALALMAGFALGRLSFSGAEQAPLAPIAARSQAQEEAAAVQRSPSSPVMSSPKAVASPVQRSRSAGVDEAAPREAAPGPGGLAPHPEPAAAATRVAARTAERQAPPARRASRGDSRPTAAPCALHDPLLRAECWLRRGHPSDALGALPESFAGRDRELEQFTMLRLLAECQLGRDVRELAERFFSRWPESPLALRVRTECPNAAGGGAGSGSGSAPSF